MLPPRIPASSTVEMVITFSLRIVKGLALEQRRRMALNTP
jgi:hypothetical protein